MAARLADRRKEIQLPGCDGRAVVLNKLQRSGHQYCNTGPHFAVKELFYYRSMISGRISALIILCVITDCTVCQPGGVYMYLRMVYVSLSLSIYV